MLLQVFVAEVPESQPESDFIEKMSMIIERFGNTITLYCTLPDTDKGKLTISLSPCPLKYYCFAMQLFLSESLAKLGIAPLSASDVSKISNGECEVACDSAIAKGVSRGTSPQLPPLDGEEECLGATGCSDQSASEDSSLTDSDRYALSISL